MKIGAVEDKLKQLGTERGSLYLFQYQQEQINSLSRQMKECTQLIEQMVNTIANLTNGTAAMSSEVHRRLKAAGLINANEDDLDPSTHNIGEPN